jgi:hypothetical protein
MLVSNADCSLNRDRKVPKEASVFADCMARNDEPNTQGDRRTVHNTIMTAALDYDADAGTQPRLEITLDTGTTLTATVTNADIKPGTAGTTHVNLQADFDTVVNRTDANGDVVAASDVGYITTAHKGTGAYADSKVGLADAGPDGTTPLAGVITSVTRLND